MSKLPNKMQEEYSEMLSKNNCQHQRFISRITKTFYYGKFPKPEGLSLPVTELATELFSEAQQGHSLNRLHFDEACTISRNICVSPCSLILAMLYLERLKKDNPEYLEKAAPSELFLVSLMVSCKFLYDDGEVDEVFVHEWAMSAGISVKQLIQLEKNFLKAINWNIFVNKVTFWEKLKEIEVKLAQRQGLLRGFFTYTELQNLLTTLKLDALVEHILSVMIILIGTYVITLLTLIGSLFILSRVSDLWLQQKTFDLHKIAFPTAELLFEHGVELTHEFKDAHQIKNEISDFNERNDFQYVLKVDIFPTNIKQSLKLICHAKCQGNDTIHSKKVQYVVPHQLSTLNWLYEYTISKEQLQFTNMKLLYLFKLYIICEKIMLLDRDNFVLETTSRFQNRNMADLFWCAR